MQRQLKTLAQACLIALITVAPAFSASGSIITASYDASVNNRYGVGENFMAAQTFLATQSGFAEEVSILLERNSSVTDPAEIIFRLTDTAAGVPNNTLGTVTVTNPGLNNQAAPFYFDVDFTSESVAIVAGQTYAWTVEVPDPVGLSLVGALPGGYADGEGFQSEDSGTSWFAPSPVGDISFIVTVIPEPASMLLLVPGLAMIASRKRR